MASSSPPESKPAAAVIREGGSASADPLGGREGRARIRRDAIIGAVLILLLVIGKVAFEHTRLGRQVTLTTYDWIQALLRPAESPVVVVDIANVPSRPWNGGRRLTDRQRLGEIVALIADEKPAAIGIDLDFSPNYDPLDPSDDHPIYHAPGDDDSEFFDLCQRIGRQGTPVYLGVYRSSKRPREQMLVRREYASLAGDIRVNLEDNRVMPRAFEWHEGGTAVRSLATSVAEAYRVEHWNVPWSLHWAVDSGEESALAGGGRVREFFVDFSNIEKLAAHPAMFIDSTGDVDPQAFAAAKARFRGKIVLLGAADSENPKDRAFAVAGLGRKAYPGVFIHAAAADTVARGPLYALTPAGRIVIDGLLAGAVLMLVVWFRLRNKGGPAQGHGDKLPARVTVLVMIAALVLGVWFVNVTRLIWDDFVLVFLAMGLHLALEHRVNRADEWWRRSFGKRIPVKEQANA